MNKKNILSSLDDLKDKKIGGYHFDICGDTLKIFEPKDNITLEIETKGKKRLTILKQIYKYTGISFDFDDLSIKEVLNKVEGKGFNKSIWTPIGKAIHKYNMIEAGDRIAIGISGGKDSLTLLNALVRLKNIANVNFEVFPIHIQPSVEKSDPQELIEYCEQLGTPYRFSQLI